MAKKQAKPKKNATKNNRQKTVGKTGDQRYFVCSSHWLNTVHIGTFKVVKYSIARKNKNVKRLSDEKAKNYSLIGDDKANVKAKVRHFKKGKKKNNK